MNNNMYFPGLKDVVVTNVEESGEVVQIHVEMELKVHLCPRCQKKTIKVHDYRIQKIQHLKWFERKTHLFYRRRRYVCECGKRFSENNPFVKRYQRTSIEWNQVISIRSIKGKTFKETAENYGSSTTTVVRRFDQISKSEIHPVKELPPVIAIDEYKGDTSEGKFQLIVANPITKEPIDILPNRNKKTIKQYLKAHGGNVQVVIMDMSPSFKAAVQEALGRPVIIADHFHFCRYIYWALDGVRRRVQKDFHSYDRKKCKRMRHIFYKANERLTEEERWYLDRYLKMSDELRKAYELKEAYRAWFLHAKEIGEDQIYTVKKELKEFYKMVEDTGIKEMCQAVKTFKNWQIEILNSFVYKYSNGFLEGINNSTKVLKRNAFGFKNYERFRAKILLQHKFKRIGVNIG
ncbi:ISL3 family transposase [Bacillus massilinigeriensis]|uniref:ISL3 family transposase n=1 Tax=Bacillus massilionigeriensis TaxID=1805475 RepID=UPI00096B0E99|nr:ISL3 family transposase [Bacillus massilionigeriensis]